jgi:hypothetical protein
MKRFAALVGSILLLACSAACSGHKTPDIRPSAGPLGLSWQEVNLPTPAGPAGRLALRDAQTCGGKWYVVGAVLGPGEDPAQVASRPAAWTSDDGRTWRAMTLQASSFYGKLQTLYTAACKDGKVAAIGAKSGGAHGNPRISTFYQQGDNLIEVTNAAFTLYGGSEAVNVGRLSAGPKGFIIAGNRVTGAAAWLSADATVFRIVENSPGLASDPNLDTQAQDGYVGDNGYVLVGGGLPKGKIDHDPFAWTSPDGDHWTRVALPRDSQYEDLQRVDRVGDKVVAVGLHGDTFGAWYSATGAEWQVGGRFGSGLSPLADVRSMAVAGNAVLVSAQDGTKYGLYTSADGGQTWRTVSMPPGAHPSGSGKGLAVAVGRGELIAAGDDGTTGRIWIANYSAQ